MWSFLEWNIGNHIDMFAVGYCMRPKRTLYEISYAFLGYDREERKPFCYKGFTCSGIRMDGTSIADTPSWYKDSQRKSLEELPHESCSMSGISSFSIMFVGKICGVYAVNCSKTCSIGFFIVEHRKATWHLVRANHSPRLRCLA